MKRPLPAPSQRPSERRGSWPRRMPRARVRNITATRPATLFETAPSTVIPSCPAPLRHGPVAQAQQACRRARKHSAEPRIRRRSTPIHPSGRAACPATMERLLAENQLPYEQLREMRSINPSFPEAETSCSWVGANTSTKPGGEEPTRAARSTAHWPILEVSRPPSRSSVLKRSMRPRLRPASTTDPLLQRELHDGLFATPKEEPDEVDRRDENRCCDAFANRPAWGRPTLAGAPAR